MTIWITPVQPSAGPTLVDFMRLFSVSVHLIKDSRDIYRTILVVMECTATALVRELLVNRKQQMTPYGFTSITQLNQQMPPGKCSRYIRTRTITGAPHRHFHRW